MKTAIVIISDPNNGEEAFARAINALAIAAEGKREGDQVEVSFIGTGTRWPAELSKITHPANAVYNEVRELVVGASCGCATFYGVSEDIKASGIDSKADNPLAGTPGVLSLRHYFQEGWQVLIF
ncbi:MAG: hypothetical protein EOP88_26165 [Verrucomicrobiaceae bacterium]|nr:MAG: hypothetical protein EOP88_26165 [Verrucomicrobiaceae bacterium]